MSVERLEDIWSSRDFPVLVAVARLLEERGPIITSSEVAGAADVERTAAIRALVNLSHGFLEVEDASSLGERDCYVRGITGRGLQATGQWPSAEAAADRLVEALDAAIENAVEGTPKASKLRAIRDSAASVGRDVLVEVMGGVLTGRIPM